MRAIRIAVAAGLLAVSISTRAVAQTADTAAKQHPVDLSDSLYLRARGLVAGGNGAAGRALVDSALAAARVGTNEYATALYWRGALASTAADAERDYRRVIVDYPFSPHSGDALLALAQLEMARGDRDPAIDHLQRFLLQQPNDPERVKAGMWLGRLLLEENQLPKACAVLLRTRAALGDTAVETRNQVDYYASRCAGVDTTAPPPRPTAQHADSARPSPHVDTARRSPQADTATPRRRPSTDTAAPRRRPSTDSAPPRRRRSADTAAGLRKSSSSPSSSAHSAASASFPKRFTVQVAAYDTRQSAEQLVDKLKGRGIAARFVESSTAPYRVRVGHYATDAEAAAAARELKDKGIVGFVTTTDNERASAPSRR